LLSANRRPVGRTRLALWLLHAIAAVVATFTPFLFDSPRSAENPMTWALFGAIVNLPAVGFAVRHLTRRVLADYVAWQAWTALALTGAWLAYAGVVALLLGAQCGELNGCRRAAWDVRAGGGVGDARPEAQAERIEAHRTLFEARFDGLETSSAK